MSRGKSYGHNRDWDPMRDDYDDSTYDAQYQDEDAGNEVQLNHCRLYITNIPKALNDEGLRTAFSKFGTLVEVYVSKDPLKRYGLVAYETPGEAKLAMMKLNRTEPLKLNIAIAHKLGHKEYKIIESATDASFLMVVHTPPTGLLLYLTRRKHNNM